MQKDYYFNVFYPFQDSVLGIVRELETEFYLTGGTAASRGYLQHRFSDDLDFFVNDDPRFALWSERIVQALSDQGLWRTEISLREERFIRLNLVREEDSLEIELVDDVPAHVGKIRQDSTLGRLDSAEQHPGQ